MQTIGDIPARSLTRYLLQGCAWAKFSFDTPMPHSQSSLLEGPEDLLKRFRIARAAADPAKVPLAAEPSGWKSLVYFRLHGVPGTYYSAYSTEFLQQLAAKISVLSRRTTVWCILRQHGYRCGHRERSHLAGDYNRLIPPSASR